MQQPITADTMQKKPTQTSGFPRKQCLLIGDELQFDFCVYLCSGSIFVNSILHFKLVMELFFCVLIPAISLFLVTLLNSLFCFLELLQP